MTSKSPQHQQLIDAIERSIGMAVATPRDFNYLSQCLRNRLNVNISVSTLKRFWGYVPNRFQPSLFTLNSLSKFIGFESWEHFLNNDDGSKSPSDRIMSNCLNVPEGLVDGDCVKLAWAPDRECVIRYLGALKFEVVESHGTRLRVGDTFKCGLIIAGEPLYLDDLRQPGHKPSVYVCGQVSGVRFEVLKEE
ncbi:MAG: hypothetical protein IK092_05025 [Muribaculaceae bacterium]|nr:hypothetical protein [Muribaculaceae bacterium]